MSVTTKTLDAPIFKDWEKLSAEERVNRVMCGIGSDDIRFAYPLFPPCCPPHLTPLRIHSISVHSTTSCSVVFAYQIPHHFTNTSRNLHGGAASTIYDICTSLALAPISRPGFWMFGGVSRVLDVKYLRAVPECEEVLIECEVVHAGKRMAATRGIMRRASDGAVLNTCEHDKVNTDPEVRVKL